MNNLVSIIIPAYNAEHFISDTIESVLNQTHLNWECLVIDDGSVDKTSEIVKIIERKDSRVRYFYKPNGGLSSARNYGLELCKGDYIQYLDADDWLFKDKLKNMLDQYKRLNLRNTALFCDFIYGTEANPLIEDKNYFKLFKNFNSTQPLSFEDIYMGWDNRITIPIHCFLYPVNLIKGLRFNENLKSKEDWDYHLQLLKNEIYFLPQNFIGCSYRVSGKSMSKNYTNMIEASFFILLKWKTNSATYIYRLSYYILQAYIYLLKRNTIFLNIIVKHFKKTNKFYFVHLILAHFCIPAVLITKALNSIRIRLK